MALHRIFGAGVILLSALGAGTAATAQNALPEGDAARGEKVFRLCKACHEVTEGKHKIGPSLYNVIGRKAGAIEGFKYSKAHAESGITWTVEVLDPYLLNPRKYIPGNRMAFAGIRNPQQRADVIAYLVSISPDAAAGGAEAEGAGN